MGVKASVPVTNMCSCNCCRLLVLLELLCSWTLRTLTLYNRSALYQFKCVNAYASVYTYLALISPFLEAKREGEKPNNGCKMHCILQLTCLLNSREHPRPEP